MDTGLVVEATVIGVPDELLGQRLVAVAAPKNGDCSENQVLLNCAERLPKYKLPGEIKFVRSLPKNMTFVISDGWRLTQLPATAQLVIKVTIIKAFLIVYLLGIPPDAIKS